MFINFKNIKKRYLTYTEALILQCAAQMRSEDFSENLAELCGGDDKVLLNLEEREYVTFIVPKKKSDTLFQRARLTKFGKETVDSFDEPILTREDEIVWDWLVKVYKAKGKEVGNAKKGKHHLSEFRSHSGIAKNSLAHLCKSFMSDESQMAWSMRLEYLFWKPVNVFETRFSLDASRLYQYYLNNKTIFDEHFEKLENGKTN